MPRVMASPTRCGVETRSLAVVSAVTRNEWTVTAGSSPSLRTYILRRDWIERLVIGSSGGVTRLPLNFWRGQPTQPSQTVRQLRTELSVPARFGTLGTGPSDRSYGPPVDAAGRSPRPASTACPPVPSGP